MKKKHKKLQIESLEARRVLTTYTVDTLQDTVDANDGVTSLREAIALANQDTAADVIEFQSNLIGTILMDRDLGEFSISQPTTIRGNGRDFTVIDADHYSRVFSVEPSAGDVTFDGVTIQNGFVFNFSFHGVGAGIFYNDTGTLTVRNSNIIGNEVGGPFPTTYSASGGGIYSANNLWIESSTVSNNHVSSRESAHAGGVQTNGRMFAINSTFAGNTAFAPQSFALGAQPTANAGGIGATELWLINSTVSGNSIISSSAFSKGAGVYAHRANIFSSTVTENTGAAGAGVATNAATFSGSIIAGNHGPDFGLLNGESPVDIDSQYTIFGNSGDIMSPAPLGAPDRNGNFVGTPSSPIDALLLPLRDNGGPTPTHKISSISPAANSDLTVWTTLPVASSVSPEVDAYVIDALRSDQRGVARLHAPSIEFFRDRGAYEEQASWVVNTTDDFHPDNDPSRTSLREAIRLASITPQVNSVVFDMDVLPNRAHFELVHGHLPITSDVIIDGPGADFIEIDAGKSSLAFVLDDNSTELSNVTIQGVTITGGASSSDGGNILSLESLTVENVVIKDGTADRGGGIFANGPTKIRDSLLLGNGSNNDGGGIYTTANLEIERSRILDNVSGSGGGATVVNATALIFDSTFGMNRSDDDGAGIAAAASNVTMAGSTFVANQSSGDGGGVFAAGGSLNITSSTFSDNSADGKGGAIAADTSQIRNSTIYDNLASNVGGIAGQATLQSTIVAGNRANFFPDVGEFALGSNNLIGILDEQDELVNGVNGNLVGTSLLPLDPKLGELGDFGGVTQVHPLLPTSPALNVGSNPLNLATDQRGVGFEREAGPPDIGAYELGNAAPKILPFPFDVGTQTNFVLNEGGTFQYQVMATDPDTPLNELRFSLLDGDGQVPEGAVIHPTTGQITWATDEEDSISVQRTTHLFNVVVNDNGVPNRSASQTIRIGVNEINTPAVLNPVPDQTVAANGTLEFTATAVDPDTPTVHSYYLLDSDLGPFPFGATIDSITGRFSFSPTGDQEGQVFYVELRLNDAGAGTQFSSTEVFKITTGSSNTGPVVNNGQVSTNEDVSVDVDLRNYASDAETTDDSLTFSVTADIGGTVQLLSNGYTARFTPTQHSHTTPASFQFSATDEQGVSAGPATIQVTVVPVNDKPIANAGTISTHEEIPVTLDLRTLVSDVEIPASAFESFRVHNPVNGTVTLLDDHTAQFTPNPDIHSPQQSFSFQYSATDLGDSSSPPLPSDSATITVQVEAINDQPVADDATISTEADVPVDIDLRTIVFDKETILDELIFTVGNGVVGLNDAVNGTVALMPDGFTARFTPAAGLSSPDSSFSFQYRVRDTGDNLAPPVNSPAGTVTVTVNKETESAPTTTDIFVGGSSWTTSFFSLVNGDSPDLPLPWTNLNTIEIHFDRAISAPTVDAISLNGINSDAYAPSGVTPVSTTVVRWTFDNLPTDAYELTVHASQIRNLDSVQLNDGNNVIQAFDIVRGDANRIGGTTVTDVVVVGNQHGQTSSLPLAYDLNGNGEVSVTDVILAGRYVGDEKPTNEPPELLKVQRIGPGAATAISDEQLRTTYEAAVDILVAGGLPMAEANVLRSDVSLSFAELAGRQLGAVSGLSIEIDLDAGGFGWFVDTSPKETSEFRRHRRSKQLIARKPTHRTQVDLLTVVLHELGHLTGEEHVNDDLTHWMSEEIVPGVRRLPASILGKDTKHHEESPNTTTDSDARPSGRRLRRVRQTFSR